MSGEFRVRSPAFDQSRTTSQKEGTLSALNSPARLSVNSNDLVSQEVFDREMAVVLPETWNFLAHESEVPHSGDFVVRYIGADSLIVVRGQDGQVRAFYNVCRHRGMQVCRADIGNTKRFVCPYHGWLYNTEGQLVSLPLDKPYFGPEGLDRSAYPLKQLERVDSYHGLIFGSANAAAPSLEDHLGDLGWYLDIHLQRDPQGLEVVGEPQRWLVGTNWKTGAENISGDTYHAGYTHRSVMEVGLHPNRATDFTSAGKRNGVNINAGPGSMGLLRQSAGERGYPEGMVDMFRQTLPRGQRDLLFGEQPLWPTRLHVFPTFSMLNIAAVIDEGKLVPFLMLRLWRPVGPDSTEIWSWIAAEKSASEEFKRDTMRAFVLTFGPTGTEEADDAENFVATEQVLSGPGARQVGQLLAMNCDLDPAWQASDWPGPGQAVSTTYSDAGNRYFWDQWSVAMGMSPAEAGDR
jgi:phenylpropionate dioxygenase-like ring-hydroxylating dioxygenase large terminal subunit